MVMKEKAQRVFRGRSVKSYRVQREWNKKQAVEFAKEVITESAVVKIRVMRVKVTLGMGNEGIQASSRYWPFV